MKFETWKIFAFASAFFAGLTAIFAKVGVKDIPSNFATLIRTFVIFGFLGLLVGFRNEWQNPFNLSRRSLVFLVLSGVATGLSWLCYYRALQTGPASLVVPIDKLSLVFAVLLSVFFLGERLNVAQWAGVCLITIGSLIIVFK